MRNAVFWSKKAEDTPCVGYGYGNARTVLTGSDGTLASARFADTLIIGPGRRALDSLSAGLFAWWALDPRGVVVSSSWCFSWFSCVGASRIGDPHAPYPAGKFWVLLSISWVIPYLKPASSWNKTDAAGPPSLRYPHCESMDGLHSCTLKYWTRSRNCKSEVREIGNPEKCRTKATESVGLSVGIMSVC